ncbi:E3 binding domain-containing protein, partial [Vibrio parahaemolyticus]
LGVDLLKVVGSGPKGRILIEDVQGYVKTTLAAPPKAAASTPTGSGIPLIPAVDFAQFGAIETKPLARIRKI